MSETNPPQQRRSEAIAVASDHAGFPLKCLLADEMRAAGLEVLDLGTDGPGAVDYPDFGKAVAEAVTGGRASRGVVVCGTGIGISIAANRYPGVRAAVCHDISSARLSRQHNDANVLAMGGRLLGVETAKDCLKAFMETPFEGGRHQNRVDKLG